MVADTIIYHPAVSHWLKYTSTTVGRDKLMRTIQYFSRFYAWYLYRLNATPAEIAPFETAKKQLGLIRKGLRLGKFIEHFRSAATAWDLKAGATDEFLRYCSIGRQLGYAGYMLNDNATFLDASGIYKSAATKSRQKNGYKAWLVGLTFSLIAGAYKVVQLSSRESKVSSKDPEGAVELKKLKKERNAVHLQLIQDMCDICGATYGVGIAPFLNDGIVGVAGTTSSLLGVYSQWKKTA